MKVTGEKIVIVGVYGSGMEKVRMREIHFGSVLTNINDFSEDGRIVVLGDMNAKVGNIEVDRVVVKHGVAYRE